MSNYKKCVDWKDILLRAGKTFVQSFIAVLSIEGFITLTDFNALKIAVLSASVATLSAIISALMNVLSCLRKKYQDKKEKEDSTQTNDDKEKD